MKLVAPFASVKLSQTKPGDLLLIVGSRSLLGLVIRLEDGKRVIGVLNDPTHHEPYHIVFERDLDCLRYNDGWLLKLNAKDAVFNSGALSERSGVIHVGSSGNVMNFGTINNRHNELTVNLATFEWDDVQPKSAAFPKWNIWANETDVTREGATPIFSFSAPTD